MIIFSTTIHPCAPPCSPHPLPKARPSLTPFGVKQRVTAMRTFLREWMAKPVTRGDLFQAGIGILVGLNFWLISALLVGFLGFIFHSTYLKEIAALLLLRSY